jgi:hypothetical protein
MAVYFLGRAEGLVTASPLTFHCLRTRLELGTCQFGDRVGALGRLGYGSVVVYQMGMPQMLLQYSPGIEHRLAAFPPTHRWSITVSFGSSTLLRRKENGSRTSHASTFHASHATNTNVPGMHKHL